MKKEKSTLDITHPDLCKQWHPTKNGDLNPTDVTAGSNKKVWWLLLYDDPNTGKHFDFEWQAIVSSRALDNAGCPFLSKSNTKVWKGFNDLATLRPDLTAEWHPTKNEKLTPMDITVNSAKKVWWYLHYFDHKTGKFFDFEWEAHVYSRNDGAGCPFLVGKAVWVGFNDLATLYPELAKQWHPTKNGKLKPTDITYGSKKRVWWCLPYDDPNTGHHVFEWKSAICDRVNGYGCTFLSNQLLWPSYNSLEAKRPDLAKEWDYEKNGTLTPKDVIVGSYMRVWWKCSKGHSWCTTIDQRCNKNSGCPHCSKELRTSFPEQVFYYYIKKAFQDAVNGDKSILKLELDIYIPSLNIAIEYDGEAWHKDIDKDIKKNLQCKNNKIHLIRIREDGCPKILEDDFCTVLSVKAGNKESLEKAINDFAEMINCEIDVNIDRDLKEIQKLMEYTIKKDSLQVLYPEISKEWHPTKNGNLKPEHVTSKSNKRVWWLLKYKDQDTGKHFDFEWPAIVSDRVRGKGCPYLSGHKIYPGFNDMSTLNPTLAAQWNYEKNKGLSDKRNGDISTPDKIGPGSHRKVWWKCPNCNHEWEDSIEKRNLGRGCPVCSKKRKKKNT